LSSKKIRHVPTEEDAVQPRVAFSVDVRDGEVLARQIHASALEIGAAHGELGMPIPFDRLPGPHRVYLIAVCDHALRRLELEQSNPGRGQKEEQL
jgi:hypothetical protein